MKHILAREFIVYVNDQAKSSAFYQKIFRNKPILDVPGMTEFQLGKNVKFGIMPNDGISRIITPTLTHPKEGNGIPRCEIYLIVADVNFEYQNALNHGAKLISEPSLRNWGDVVCYFSDLDGHVIAFAQKQ